MTCVLKTAEVDTLLSLPTPAALSLSLPAALNMHSLHTAMWGRNAVASRGWRSAVGGSLLGRMGGSRQLQVWGERVDSKNGCPLQGRADVYISVGGVRSSSIEVHYCW